MILVTGATGYTGRFLVRRLVGEGVGCRCLVRPSSDRAELDELGVEVCCGDLAMPEQVRGALRDVKQVLHLAHIRFAAALASVLPATVQRVLLVSSMWRYSKVACPEVEQVVEAEAQVVGTSMPYTLVRPTMIYGRAMTAISVV